MVEAGLRFATASGVSPRVAGRLHRPDDAQAGPHEAPGSRRAAALIGLETARLPRQGQWRLVAAYMRSDRRPGAGRLAGAPGRVPGHGLLHPGKAAASRRRWLVANHSSVRRARDDRFRRLRKSPANREDRPMPTQTRPHVRRQTVAPCSRNQKSRRSLPRHQRRVSVHRQTSASAGYPEAAPCCP